MALSAPITLLKRRAKLLARQENIPLHIALDRIARQEGYAKWSLLAARVPPSVTAGTVLPQLSNGDMLLLGARTGQGKTLMGVQLVLDAVRIGRAGVFFTLELSENEAQAHFRRYRPDVPPPAHRVDVVTSDEICADYIMEHLSDAPSGTVAVVDYLQILDQRRDNPPLSAQITALEAFAKKTGNILVFISQIARSFDPARKALPDMQDIRLPNKLDTSLFSKACFLHAGKIRLQSLT
jgi:hypothetical protein